MSARLHALLSPLSTLERVWRTFLLAMDERHRKHRTREHSSHRRHHRNIAVEERGGRASHYARPDASRELIPIPAPVHHTLQEPLANQEDFVHKWLAQTADELPESAFYTSKTQMNTEIPTQSNAQRPKFPQFLQVKDHDRDPQPLERDGNGNRGKQGLEMSSESSFLERGRAPEAKRDKHERGNDDVFDLEIPSHHPERKKRKRSPSPDVEVSSVISVERPKETFERRARHKTKEDRYDSKKKPEKKPKERKSKPKKEKMVDRKAKKSGENLMNNFESKHVGNDRLTIRPSQKLGLFKHGRASSPVRRRGLPDLAFSEMEFLQRSKHGTSHRQENIPPRQRHKDRRREERTFNEITSYFTAGKNPLAEIDTNQRDTERAYAKRLPDKIYGQSHGRQAIDSDREEHLRQSSVPEDIDFPDKPFLGFGRQASLPTKHRPPTTRTPRREVTGKATDTTSRFSEQATTYQTWSESIVSPSADPRLRRRQHNSGHGRSSTPESVRQAIAKTGVLRGTGLQRHVAPPSSQEIRARLRELQEDAERSSLGEQQSNRVGSPGHTRTNQRQPNNINGDDDANLDGQSNPSIDVTAQPGKLDLSRLRADVAQQTIEVPRKPTKNVLTEKKSPPQLVVHHYDREVGWHQGQVAEGRAKTRSLAENSAPAEPVRPSRTQLAQTAYIRPQSKNALRDVDACEVGKETSVNIAVNELPKTARPATAPPKTSMATAARPHSAAVTASAAIPSHETRPPSGPGIELGPISNQGGSPHYQTAEVTSLPPLTDRVSSSMKRTESAPSARNIQAHEQHQMLPIQLPEKPSMDTSGHFGLPVRGGQTPHPPSIRRVSSADITGSLYGQQLEREHASGFENDTLGTSLNGNFLHGDELDIDFQREQAFIQGLNHQFLVPQNVPQYQEYQEIDGVELGAEGMDFDIPEDDVEYYEPPPQYNNGDFRESFRPNEYEYQERDQLMEPQENIFARNRWDGEVNYGAGYYQSYGGQELLRPDVLEEEAENSLVGFWRPNRQY